MRRRGIVILLIVFALCALLLVMCRGGGRHRANASETESARAHMDAARKCTALPAEKHGAKSELHRCAPVSESNHVDVPTDSHDPGDSGAGQPRLEVLERGRVREASFASTEDSWHHDRRLAKARFDYDQWPLNGVGLKAGFRFVYSGYSALNGFEEWPAFSGFLFGTMDPNGYANEGAVWWGMGGYKVGVQRRFSLKKQDSAVYVTIFVGDRPRDAHTHLIDMISVGMNSANTKVYQGLVRDRIRLGDVCLTGAGAGPHGKVIFVRANIYVEVRASVPMGIDVAALAADIDAAIAREPDVDEAGLDALRPKIETCTLTRRFLVASPDIHDPRMVTEVKYSTTDARGGAVHVPDIRGKYFGSLRRYDFSEGVPRLLDKDQFLLSVSRDCPSGLQSAYLTAINEHLLCSVYELKVPVVRED